MKYYVLVISNGDSKIKGKAVYEYDNQHDAVASFHSELGKAMKSDLYIDCLVMVVDSDGAIYKSEKVNGKYVEYVEPVEEPIEEVTEQYVIEPKPRL